MRSKHLQKPPTRGAVVLDFVAHYIRVHTSSNKTLKTLLQEVSKKFKPARWATVYSLSQARHARAHHQRLQAVRDEQDALDDASRVQRVMKATARLSPAQFEHVEHFYYVSGYLSPPDDFDDAG